MRCWASPVVATISGAAPSQSGSSATCAYRPSGLLWQLCRQPAGVPRMLGAPDWTGPRPAYSWTAPHDLGHARPRSCGSHGVSRCRGCTGPRRPEQPAAGGCACRTPGVPEAGGGHPPGPCLAHSGATPRARQRGLARRVGATSSSSAARRAGSQVLGAWIAAWRRRGALPRRCWAALCLATRCRRRASRAQSASAWASGQGRGMGRTAAAPWAQARASSAHC
jgi:hypothetical protein